MTKKRVKQTETQLQVLKAVKTWWTDQGFAPSQRNLARQIGLSQATVSEALDKLDELKLIARKRGHHGTLNVSAQGNEFLKQLERR